MIKCTNCGDNHKSSYMGCNEYFKATCIQAICNRQRVPWKRAEYLFKLELKSAKDEQEEQENKECQEWLNEASRSAKSDSKYHKGHDSTAKLKGKIENQSAEGQNSARIKDKVTTKPTPVNSHKKQNSILEQKCMSFYDETKENHYKKLYTPTYYNYIQINLPQQRRL